MSANQVKIAAGESESWTFQEVCQRKVEMGSSALSVQVRVPLLGRAGRVPAVDGNQRVHTFVA
jgi:hypothetical protein